MLVRISASLLDNFKVRRSVFGWPFVNLIGSSSLSLSNPAEEKLVQGVKVSVWPFSCFTWMLVTIYLQNIGWLCAGIFKDTCPFV